MNDSDKDRSCTKRSILESLSDEVKQEVHDRAIWKDERRSPNDPYWFDPKTGEKVFRVPEDQPHDPTPILRWQEEHPDDQHLPPQKRRKITYDDAYLPQVQYQLRGVRLGTQFRFSSSALIGSFMLRRHHMLRLRKDPSYIVEYLTKYPSDGLYLFALYPQAPKFKNARRSILDFSPYLGEKLGMFKNRVATQTFNHLYPAYSRANFDTYYLKSILVKGEDVTDKLDKAFNAIEAIQEEAKAYGSDKVDEPYGKFTRDQLWKMIERKVDGLQCELYCLDYFDQKIDSELLKHIIKSYATPELFFFTLVYNFATHKQVDESILAHGLKYVPGLAQEIIYLNQDLLDPAYKGPPDSRHPYVKNERLLEDKDAKDLLTTLKEKISDTQIEEYIKDNPYDFKNLDLLFGDRGTELKDKCKAYYDRALKEAKIHKIDPNQYFLVKLLKERDLSEINVKELKSKYANDFNFSDPYFLDLFRQFPNIIKREDIDYTEELNKEKEQYNEGKPGKDSIAWKIEDLLKYSIPRVFPFKTSQQCIFPDKPNLVYALENHKSLLPADFFNYDLSIKGENQLLRAKWQASTHLVQSFYHELQRGRRIVAWIRFTQLKEDTIWIDEIQSDLIKILVPARAKEMENLLRTMLLNFIDTYKTKHGVTRFYYPNTNTKERLYHIRPPRSIYEDLPRKCRFKPVTFEGVNKKVDNFPGYVFEALAI